MMYRRPGSIYIVIFVLVLVLLVAPIFIKGKLKILKERDKGIKSTQIHKQKKVASFNEIIEIIGEHEPLHIEELNIMDEFKEVVVLCNENMQVIKTTLEKLKLIESVYDITEIEFNENLWKIKVIFN